MAAVQVSGATEPAPSRSLISSDEAKDLRWFFRWAASAFGFRAQVIEVASPPSGKRPAPLWDEVTDIRTRLPEVEVPEQGNPIAPTKSRQVRVASPDRITDRNLEAVRRERRIRRAVETLEPVDFQVLRLAYEGKRHSLEIHQELGDFADLAMHMPRARTAYAKYVAKFKPQKLGQQPFSLETWLVILSKHGDPLLAPLRDDVEEVVSRALGIYANVVAPPSREELPPAPPPKPRKRPAPRAEQGIPFLPAECA